MKKKQGIHITFDIPSYIDDDGVLCHDFDAMVRHQNTPVEEVHGLLVVLNYHKDNHQTLFLPFEKPRQRLYANFIAQYVNDTILEKTGRNRFLFLNKDWISQYRLLFAIGNNPISSLIDGKSIDTIIFNN